MIYQIKCITTQGFGFEKAEASFVDRLKQAFEDLNNVNTL